MIETNNIMNSSPSSSHKQQQQISPIRRPTQAVSSRTRLQTKNLESGCRLRPLVHPPASSTSHRRHQQQWRQQMRRVVEELQENSCLTRGLSQQLKQLKKQSALSPAASLSSVSLRNNSSKTKSLVKKLLVKVKKEPGYRRATIKVKQERTVIKVKQEPAVVVKQEPTEE